VTLDYLFIRSFQTTWVHSITINIHSHTCTRTQRISKMKRKNISVTVRQCIDDYIYTDIVIVCLLLYSACVLVYVLMLCNITASDSDDK